MTVNNSFSHRFSSRHKNVELEEVISASVATDRKDTSIVTRAIRATNAHRDCWPEHVETPLKIFWELGYSADLSHVKGCIGHFIENQHEDGGWGYYNEIYRTEFQHSIFHNTASLSQRIFLPTL